MVVSRHRAQIAELLCGAWPWALSDGLGEHLLAALPDSFGWVWMLTCRPCRLVAVGQGACRARKLWQRLALIGWELASVLGGRASGPLRLVHGGNCT